MPVKMRYESGKAREFTEAELVDEIEKRADWLSDVLDEVLTRQRFSEVNLNEILERFEPDHEPIRLIPMVGVDDEGRNELPLDDYVDKRLGEIRSFAKALRVAAGRRQADFEKFAEVVRLRLRERHCPGCRCPEQRN